jgi:hypothetical protein
MQVCPVGFFCFNRDTLLITIVAVAMVISFFINKNNSMFDLIKSQLELQKQTLANKLNIIEESTIDPIEVKNLERISNPFLSPERSYPYRVPHGPAAALINVPTRGFSGPVQQVGYLIDETPIKEIYTKSPLPTTDPVSPMPTISPTTDPVSPPTDNPVAIEIKNAADKISEKLDTVVEKYVNYDNRNSRKMLPLFGGIYSGSGNKWVYHVIDNNIKIPISYNGRTCDDASYGCDEIYDGTIISLPHHIGKFRVSIYKQDAPKYIPYII